MKVNSSTSFRFQNLNYLPFSQKAPLYFEMPRNIYNKDFRDAYVSVIAKSQTKEANSNPLLATVNKLKSFLKDSFTDEVYHEFNEVKAAIEKISYDKVA